MKLYYFVGYLLKPFAVASLIIYSRVTGRPRTRIIVQDDQGQILLLQSWLSGDKWGLPGGGADQGEDPASAAIRELAEETGIILTSELLQPVGTLRSSGHEEVVFTTSAQGNLPSSIPNRFEIKSIEWFSLDALPSLEPLAHTIINHWQKSI